LVEKKSYGVNGKKTSCSNNDTCKKQMNRSNNRGFIGRTGVDREEVARKITIQEQIGGGGAKNNGDKQRRGKDGEKGQEKEVCWPYIAITS
jgi:hypothetical protein